MVSGPTNADASGGAAGGDGSPTGSAPSSRFPATASMASCSSLVAAANGTPNADFEYASNASSPALYSWRSPAGPGISEPTCLTHVAADGGAAASADGPYSWARHDSSWSGVRLRKCATPPVSIDDGGSVEEAPPDAEG